jgi:GNAT superfamily N-acetyltransferase
MVFGPTGSGEVRVELRDGAIVVVRPIREDDRDAVRRAFSHLSAQSRFQRFMTGVSELSDRDLDYLVVVDHHDHEALIAFEEESGFPAGVARFVRLDDGASAEAAVTVIDDWQGRGLGTVLLTLLAERARREDVRRFVALLLASNEQMLEVLAALGPARLTPAADGTIEVEVDIPREGIGEHMAGVLRVAAGGTVELATPPWGLRRASG